MSHRKIYSVILCSLFLMYCTEEQNKAVPTREPLPHEILEELVLKERDKGNTIWVLKADKAVNYEEEEVIKVYDIELEFYDAGEVISSVLTADSGVVFTTSKDMHALGDVKVVTRENGELETDLLEWNNFERLIRTESEIRITTDESVITGIGFESDPDLKHMKIRHQFRAEKIGD